MEPGELGLFPLSMALVPGELMPLHIFEPRYRDLVADCLEREVPFVLLYADEDGARELGCTARVAEVVARFDDGRMDIVVEGAEVVRVTELMRGHSYLSGRVEPAEDDLQVTGDEAARAVELYTRIADLSGIDADPAALPGEQPVSYTIVSRVELPAHDKQRVIEERTERGRLTLLCTILQVGLDNLAAATALADLAQSNGHSEHGPLGR